MTLPPVSNPIKLLMLQLRAESGLTALDTTEADWLVELPSGGHVVRRLYPRDVPMWVQRIWWDVLS